MEGTNSISSVVNTVIQKVAAAIPCMYSEACSSGQGYQNALLDIRGSHDMNIIAEELANSKLFAEDGDQFVKVLARQDVQVRYTNMFTATTIITLAPNLESRY